MPILYSDRLYFTAVDRVVTETKSAFERIMYRTLIGSFLSYVPLNKSELHNGWNWDNVSHIRMKVIDKALILMLNHNLASATFCKINNEKS